MSDHCYTLFDVTLASQIELPWLVGAARAPCAAPDLALEQGILSCLPIAWRGTPPLGVSQWRTTAGAPLWELYRLPEGEVLHFPDLVDFYLERERVRYDLLDPARREWVQIYFLGAVMAFWLERRGVPVLHASAVQIPRGVLGFASISTGGKSTLAAAAVAAGHALVADDLLALEERAGRVWARPSFPAMRLWAAEAARYIPHWQELPRVEHKAEKRWAAIGPGGWGAFCAETQPLACLYFPQRRAAADPNVEIEITTLTRRDGLIELVRHSFAAWLTEASGMAPQRLPRLARLAQGVPLRRLVYPSGLAHLPRVWAALEQDQL